MRSVIPVLVVLAALPVLGASKKSSTRPPSHLHKVGDHFTPYIPPDPAAFPAGTSAYTIVKGDTLWALGQKFYGNAYLWPQLWEANTYITDAHWIYPGDPLQVQGEAASGSSTTETRTTVSTDTSSGGTTVGQTVMTAEQNNAAGQPIALGVESDIYCWGYLGDLDETMPNRIAGFEDVELKFTPGAKVQSEGVGTGELIFVDGGTTTGINAGDTYLVVMPAEVVHHPKSGAILGRHYDFRGRVKILCAGETRSTALVTQACKDLHIGDRLKPMPEIPIPLARLTPMNTVCSPPSGKTAGFIVNSKDFYYALGEGNILEIDLGRDDLVQPGDFLTVYRELPEKGVPRQLLGEIGVLTAEAHSATAKIVRMRYSIKVGDRIELK
ncbi:MAG TPA: LysM peptidoglycan-binding domain-containing protein [Thermoanaerobaculia bacterium]|nr:LysM peptidoglycan-binding domain-containing protein [Thermoanaerobaculia bacterium]